MRSTNPRSWRSSCSSPQRAVPKIVSLEKPAFGSEMSETVTAPTPSRAASHDSKACLVASGSRLATAGDIVVRLRPMAAHAPERRSVLGAYLLPGRVRDPRAAVGQAQAAEHLGLGTVWISERWGTKDLAVLAGAVGQATSEVRIAAGITHFLVRHPVILASTAMTLQALTGGRFVLGVGRSVGPMWTAVGLPQMTNRVIVDSADIVRRLCRGEKVRYDGPAGRYPILKLGDLPDLPDAQPPPLVFAAI